MTAPYTYQFQLQFSFTVFYVLEGVMNQHCPVSGMKEKVRKTKH
jgi:hypothetical protein